MMVRVVDHGSAGGILIKSILPICVRVCHVLETLSASLTLAARQNILFKIQQYWKSSIGLDLS